MNKRIYVIILMLVLVALVATVSIQSIKINTEPVKNNGLVKNTDEKTKVIMSGGCNPLRVTKSDGKANSYIFRTSEIITYRIFIRNPNDCSISEIDVIDELPLNVTIINKSDNGIQYVDKENKINKVIWSNKALNAYQNMTLYINASIDTDIQNAKMISNYVSVYADSVFQDDDIERSKIWDGQPPFPYEPINITKYDNPDHLIKRGERIHYKITIENPNKLDCNNIIVWDKIPDCVSDFTFMGPYQPDQQGSDYYWTIPYLKNNTKFDIDFSAKVSDSCPYDNVTNYANVTSYETKDQKNETFLRTNLTEFTPPTIYWEIFQPMIQDPCNPEKIWLSTRSKIKITAIDEDGAWPNTGVKKLMYRMSKNGVWGPWTEIEDNQEEDEDTTDRRIIVVNTNFKEECLHKIQVKAMDNSKNWQLNSDINDLTFYVDDTPPKIKSEILGFHDPCFHKFGDRWYTGIKKDTEIKIKMDDDSGCKGSGVGIKYLEYEVWHANDFGEWVKIYETTLNDIDPCDEDNFLSTSFSIQDFSDESGWYQIHYWGEDLLGNRDPMQGGFKSINLILDDDAPETTSKYVGKTYYDSVLWLGKNTKKIIHAIDSGGIPGGSGVKRVEWIVFKKDYKEVDGEIIDIWKETDHRVVLDNGRYDIDCTPARFKYNEYGALNETTVIEGGIFAWDHIGEPYIFWDKDPDYKWQFYDDDSDLTTYNPKTDDKIINYDPDQNGINADPMIGDIGGLFAKDQKGDPFIFLDWDGNWKYNEYMDWYLPDYPFRHPDWDGCSQMKIKDTTGGLYALDNQEPPQPFTFKDIGNDKWYFDDDGPENLADDIVVEWNPENDGPIGEISLEIQIKKSCEHLIQHTAIDMVGNEITKKQYVKVDADAPVSLNNTGLSLAQYNKCTYSKKVNGEKIQYYHHIKCANTSTPIILKGQDIKPYDAEDCKSGVESITYEIWLDNGDEKFEKDYDILLEGPITIELFDEDEHTIYFEEECRHWLIYYATDKLGNYKVEKQFFKVDDEKPDVSINLEEGSFIEVEQNQVNEPDYWITSDTKIYINAINTGCISETDEGYNHDSIFWSDLSCFDNECIPLSKPVECKTRPLNKVFYRITQGEHGTPGEWKDITVHLNNNRYYFTLSHECKYKLEIYAWDIVDPYQADGHWWNLLGPEEIKGNTINEFYQSWWFYVDDTGPYFEIIKPVNGWYAEGHGIPSEIRADDLPNPQQPCYGYQYVGIEDQSPGEGWIIDVQPKWTEVELNTERFRYNCNALAYFGFLDIPMNTGLDDGTVLFVAGAKDSLGNGASIIYEKIKQAYQNAGGNINDEGEGAFDLLEFNDLIQPLIDNNKVRWIGFNTAEPSSTPSVKIIEPSNNGEITEDMIHFVIEASDLETPTEDLDIKILIESPGYPPMLYYAAYDGEYFTFDYTDFVNGYKDGTQIKFTAYATDTDYETGVSLPIILEISNDVMYDQYMTKGWNSISIGIGVDDFSVENVFSSILDNVDIIFEQDTLKNYIPGQAGNTLTTIDPNKTYWVKMKNVDQYFITEET